MIKGGTGYRSTNVRPIRNSSSFKFLIFDIKILTEELLTTSAGSEFDDGDCDDYCTSVCKMMPVLFYFEFS